MRDLWELLKHLVEGRPIGKHVMIGFMELLILLGAIYALTRLIRSRVFREKFLLLLRRIRGFFGRRPLLGSFLLGFLALLLAEPAFKPGHHFSTLMYFVVLISAICLFVRGIVRLIQPATPVTKILVTGGLFGIGMVMAGLLGALPPDYLTAPTVIPFFLLLVALGFLFFWEYSQWEARRVSSGTQSATCPPVGRLKDLLAERLAPKEHAQLAAHLEVCPACQYRVEGLTAGQKFWTAMARKLTQPPPPPEPALKQVMDSLKGKKEPEETTDEPVFAGDLPLNFLSPTDKPGQLGRLERYEVLEEIGRGGMGVVLKAFDPTLHRVVAIKVLAPQLATSGVARKRFLREAKAAAAVMHDHIVTIHAVDEANGLPYLVMQYIAGQSLQQRIDKDGPLELAEILRIGMQTASGLAAAHGQGIVHRDIKPANILLEEGVQRVKITDFGLARAMDDASLTQSGFVAGSPLYMAPEQARGEALDHRADLFSLGSVLYTMCTGRPPFRAANTLAVLRRVSEDAPRPIRETNPEIPDWLADVVDRLMAKDPADRYQSAGEVVEVLGKHLAQLQHAAWVPPPAPSPAPAGAEAGLPTSLTICPSCGANLHVPEAMVGTIVHCAECGKPFQVEEGSEVIQVARAVKPPFGPGFRARRRLPRWVWIAAACAAFFLLLIFIISVSYESRGVPRSIGASSGSGKPFASQPPQLPPDHHAAFFWRNTLGRLPADATLFGAIDLNAFGPLTLNDPWTQTLLRLLVPRRTANQVTSENLGRIEIHDVALGYYEGTKAEDARAIVQLQGVAQEGYKRITRYIRRNAGGKVQIEEQKANGSVCVSSPQLDFALKIVNDHLAYLAASGNRNAEMPQHRKVLDQVPAAGNNLLSGYQPPWVKNTLDQLSSDVCGFLIGEIPTEMREPLTDFLELRVCPRTFILSAKREGDAVVLSLTLNLDKAGADQLLREDLGRWCQKGIENLRREFPVLDQEQQALVRLGQTLKGLRWETRDGSVRTQVRISSQTWQALRDLLNRIV